MSSSVVKFKCKKTHWCTLVHVYFAVGINHNLDFQLAIFSVTILVQLIKHFFLNLHVQVTVICFVIVTLCCPVK